MGSRAVDNGERGDDEGTKERRESAELENTEHVKFRLDAHAHASRLAALNEFRPGPSTAPRPPSSLGLYDRDQPMQRHTSVRALASKFNAPRARTPLPRTAHARRPSHSAPERFVTALVCGNMRRNWRGRWGAATPSPGRPVARPDAARLRVHARRRWAVAQNALVSTRRTTRGGFTARRRITV